MKKIILSILILSFLTFMQNSLYAQKRNHPKKNGIRHKNVVIYKHSRYRPHKRIKVFHPYWNPRFSYHRRWIYFPKYNLYWDNWRNQYVFLNNNVWVVQAARPPVIVNINLEREQQQELEESNDDIDEIYLK
jgi:hypothetical protein